MLSFAVSILYWKDPSPDRPLTPATFYIGFGLYFLSFFLPAIDLAGNAVPGWMCAWMAFIGDGKYESRLAIFGGLINPIVITYIVLEVRNRAWRVRKTLALSVLAFIPITWFSLTKMDLGIRVGHVLWILGMLLILVPVRTKWPTLHEARWLVIPPALIVVWWGMKEANTPRLLPSTDQDRFIYQVAVQFKQPELCQKISQYAVGNGSMDTPGYQVSYLQSECYFKLASAVGDISLCDKVRPVSQGMHDGSKYTPKSCREYRGYAAVGLVDPHTVGTWMRRLGYTDHDLHHFQYRAVFNNPIYEAYDRFRRDDQFTQRLRAAPSFAEPIVANKSHAPNDLEYVYGMFAVDAYDSTFCAKISENAVVRRLSPQLVPMRVECYHDVALNKLDLAACGKLPTRNDLSPGSPDSESRETCSHDVAAIRSSLEMIKQPLKGLRSGPVFPPTFESFQSALHDLGYNVDFPQLTDTDYEDFLTYLERDNPSGRAAFLQRVEALK